MHHAMTFITTHDDIILLGVIPKIMIYTPMRLHAARTANPRANTKSIVARILVAFSSQRAFCEKKHDPAYRTF